MTRKNRRNVSRRKRNVSKRNISKRRNGTMRKKNIKRRKRRTQKAGGHSISKNTVIECFEYKGTCKTNICNFDKFDDFSDDYISNKFLGDGAFSDVFLYKNVKTDDEIAVKKLKTDKQATDKETFNAEGILHCYISKEDPDCLSWMPENTKAVRPRWVKGISGKPECIGTNYLAEFKGFVDIKSEPPTQSETPTKGIVLKYYKGGDLKKFINLYKCKDFNEDSGKKKCIQDAYEEQTNNADGAVKSPSVDNLVNLLFDLATNRDSKIKFIKKIIKGLKYLHKIGVVHRDLAPRNIFLHQENGEIIPKIADFGLSRIMTLSGGSSQAGSEKESTTVNHVNNKKTPPEPPEPPEPPPRPSRPSHCPLEGIPYLKEDKVKIDITITSPCALQKPMKFSAKSDIHSLALLIYSVFTGKNNIFTPKKITKKETMQLYNIFTKKDGRKFTYQIQRDSMPSLFFNLLLDSSAEPAAEPAAVSAAEPAVPAVPAAEPDIPPQFKLIMAKSFIGEYENIDELEVDLDKDVKVTTPDTDTITITIDGKTITIKNKLDGNTLDSGVTTGGKPGSEYFEPQQRTGGTPTPNLGPGGRNPQYYNNFEEPHQRVGNEVKNGYYNHSNDYNV
jgi:serine/threonine protein kinase